MVQKEIDEAESTRHGGAPKKASPANNASKSAPKNQPSKAAPQIDQRTARKQIGNLEKTIAKLDQQKKELNQQLMETIDPQAALKLHEELTKVSEELDAAETRWAELQEQLEDE